MLYFELALALIMFLFLWFVTPQLFYYIVNSPDVYGKSMEYLSTRSWGVFFAYVGVSFIALYSGLAKTKFIIIDAAILAIVNLVLNYALIFGHWGFPEMGIKGAGLASTIAEIVAVVIFIIYIFVEKREHDLNLGKLPPVELDTIKRLVNISSPIVIQSAVGVGSWFIFFALIEKLGEQALAITNLARISYLILAVPCFGYAAGINTLVSSFIGRAKHMAVLPIIQRTSFISFISTVIVGIPVIFLPEYTLYPILGTAQVDLMRAAQPVFYIVFVIMLIYSVAIVYYNGLLGTGATWYALMLQVITVIVYLAIVYIVIGPMGGSLELAWAVEIFYWLAIVILSYIYLATNKWRTLKV